MRLSATEKFTLNVGLGTFMLCIALIIMIIYGWIANVVDIIHTLNGPINALFVARIAGVFVAPLGAILGYF